MNYSQISQPLFYLCSKSIKFEWSDECEIAFNDLKKKLSSNPVLRLPDIITDASGYCGVVLSQKDNKGGEYIKACASRLITKAEKNYTITEKECLALIFGFKKFRTELHGAQAIVDHAALVYLKSIKNPTGRLARWIIFLKEFDFDIIYKKGSTLANADALSRPVIDYLVTVECTEEDEIVISSVSIKEVNQDVWEDANLLHYIQFNRLIAGLSKKELLFLKNNVQLEVPKPEDRKIIIEKAQNFGHFRADSTLHRIKESYTWPNMLALIKRVSIDLVFGLNKTNDGFIGIAVIIEILTKFCYAEAIRSKEASEIANILNNYISLFGPFEELLSDHGREFCNQILDKLKNNIGFRHITTSAFNPLTNGITERFNQTLIEALRKHAEANLENWPQYLPYVLMAYRSRVHLTTGFTTFELMFGRKMLPFLDWTDKEYDSSAIVKRSEEINFFFNRTHTKAIENIKNNQIKQVKNQNSAQNTVLEKIPNGSTVFIKCEGLLMKLEARFKGSYKVIGQTKRGNYLLSNALNEKLPDSVPRHKLKIVENDESLPPESAEVEKILKDKMVEKESFY
ncbi:unnamed protein product [Brachionus calyciflorus]|uniref:Integrase catalytic domain-containing protein n=1 Tax=Brachionus calyciflorus TaxID=104777 RepID=A0A814GJA3_9BILA|nr:unnamed protein product [Brachionus calyciflorus]